MVGTLDLHAVLKLIADNAVRLLGATQCSIMLLDDRREYLTIRMAVGLPEEIVKSTRVRVGEGIAGKVAQTGKPVFVANVDKAGLSHRDRSHRYKRVSFMSLPLKARGKVIGVLNLTDKREGEFTQEDSNLAGVFADQAAIAINNAAMHRK